MNLQIQIKIIKKYFPEVWEYFETEREKAFDDGYRCGLRPPTLPKFDDNDNVISY